MLKYSENGRAWDLAETVAYGESAAAGALLSRAEIEEAAQVLPAHEVRRLACRLSDQDVIAFLGASSAQLLADAGAGHAQADLFRGVPRRTQSRLEDFGLVPDHCGRMAQARNPSPFTAEGRALGVILSALLAGRGPEVAEALR